MRGVWQHSVGDEKEKYDPVQILLMVQHYINIQVIKELEVGPFKKNLGSYFTFLLLFWT